MSIEVGAKVTGKITGITNFGAFIDLGEGKTGLVHISEVSDGFIKDINDVLTVGDETTVKVLSIGDDGKIGLSIRKAVDKPKFEDKKREERRNFKPNFEGGHRNHHAQQGNHGRSNKQNSFGGRRNDARKQDFDSLLAGFLKDSEDRLTSLKRNTEGKRGGRGGRRS